MRYHVPTVTAKYTLRDFRKEFPDDDSCLEWLMEFMYPGGAHCHLCQKVTKHHRVRTRKSYSCDQCGHHVHPTAGTIYHKSSTPLTLWFYAVFLMSNTRTGVSAKHLQRELGVTYKTAWRMFRQIRSMLDETDDPPLGGTVEVDETLLYGKPRRTKTRTIVRPKTTIIGAVEREGRVKTQIISAAGSSTCMRFVRANVQHGANLYTDESAAYNRASSEGYTHATVTHWDHEYVRGIVHTNSIEGFWGNFKTGMRGSYKHCGVHYLQSYLNEFSFRYNRRKSEVPMFQHFMAQHRQLDWWVPYSERR